jgi:phosphate transport system substrate-binding protein
MEMNYLLMIIGILLFSLAGSSLAGNVGAERCGANIMYEGKGAGQVVFDGTLHSSKGFSCSVCHEQHGLSSALFEMKKGADAISMRKMQLGSSCGYCHDGTKAFSVTDYLQCANCHHK